MTVFRELRVHGVSGTPPREMLATDPITLDPKSEHIRIFRRPPPDRSDDADGVTHEFQAEAYHWGSVTTGHWLTALWVLLGPFAFANVAGWMTSRPSRLAHSAVRLAGLALTALIVVQAGYLFLEIAPQLAPAAWRKAVLGVAAAAYPFLFIWGLVMRLSTQSHFTKFTGGERLRHNLSPKEKHLLPRTFWSNPTPAGKAGQWDDPAGTPVTSDVVWDQHAILNRLRRIHLVVGCGVVVALYATGTDSDLLRWLAAGTAAIAVTLVIATGITPRARWVRLVTAWAPLAAVAMVAGGWFLLTTSPTPPSPWPFIHETTFLVALSFGATAVATAAAGLPSLGAIVVGGLFGASLGVGAGLLGEAAAGVSQLTANGAGWVAVAMLLLVLTAVGTGALLAITGEPIPRYGGLMALARRASTRARILLVVLALFGVAAGTLAFGVGCVVEACTPALLTPPGPDSPVRVLAVGLAALVVLFSGVAVSRVSRRLGLSVVLVGGIGTALFAARLLPSVGFAGLDFDGTDLVDVAKLVVVLIPTVLIGRSMLGSIRRGTSNRQVGVIWDVASMWPRWFHPLAPPAYGPLVIGDLAHRLTIGPPELLEAHSQGSVLAALAVSRMEEQPKFAMISYGSPLGLLYRPLFPSVGIDDLIEEVDARLGGRWINLWRDTDPLGGMPITLTGRDIRVRDGTGHSGYETSHDFVEARHLLV